MVVNPSDISTIVKQIPIRTESFNSFQGNTAHIENLLRETIKIQKNKESLKKLNNTESNYNSDIENSSTYGDNNSSDDKIKNKSLKKEINKSLELIEKAKRSVIDASPEYKEYVTKRFNPEVHYNQKQVIQNPKILSKLSDPNILNELKNHLEKSEQIISLTYQSLSDKIFPGNEKHSSKLDLFNHLKEIWEYITANKINKVLFRTERSLNNKHIGFYNFAKLIWFEIYKNRKKKEKELLKKFEMQFKKWAVNDIKNSKPWLLKIAQIHPELRLNKKIIKSIYKE